MTDKEEPECGFGVNEAIPLWESRAQTPIDGTISNITIFSEPLTDDQLKALANRALFLTEERSKRWYARLWGWLVGRLRKRALDECIRSLHPILYWSGDGRCIGEFYLCWRDEGGEWHKKLVSDGEES